MSLWFYPLVCPLSLLYINLNPSVEQITILGVLVYRPLNPPPKNNSNQLPSTSTTTEELNTPPEAVKEEIHRRRSIIYSNIEQSIRSGDYNTDAPPINNSPPPSVALPPRNSGSIPVKTNSTMKRNNVPLIRSLSSIDPRLLTSDPNIVKEYQIETERVRSLSKEKRNSTEHKDGANTPHSRTRRYSSVRMPLPTKDHDNLKSISSPRDDAHSTRKIRVSSVAPRIKDNDTTTRKPATRANYNPIGSNLFKSTYSSSHYQRNKK